MSDTPEWYVTEYPVEGSFAITDGYEIFAQIIGGKTVGDECDLANRIAKLPDLERERDEAMEQLRKASVEANTLATSIQKAEYPDAKEFELLGSVAGVISQIDNMYAGVRQQRDEAVKQIHEEARDYELQIRKLCEAYNNLGEQNAKLRDIADRAIIPLECDGVPWGAKLRAELDQLKEETK